MIEIKIPMVGESITEVTLLKWIKVNNEYVNQDEIIAELESEKATFEVTAEKAGILLTLVLEGGSLKVGDIMAQIDDKAVKPTDTSSDSKNEKIHLQENKINSKESQLIVDVKTSPVAAAIIADKKLDSTKFIPSGPQGKILKEDVLAALNKSKHSDKTDLNARTEKEEKMSSLRKTISQRLVEAKNTTAMLTTFNEVNMQHVMEIRNQYKDKFKETHGVGLGFMSFFVKASCYALKEWPTVNAYINGDNIIYHDYCDISIAVSTPRGLTVPVIRNAESFSMAEIEKNVAALANKARENKLTMNELQGGTFTITNGGVFGSLLSTPIINAPQSAILGMHKIEERPIAKNGQVVVKPMMYLALSYDHRIIDGRESVSFLVRVKELLENPEQLFIGVDPVKALLEL